VIFLPFQACTPKVKDRSEKDVILAEVTQTIAGNEVGDGLEDVIDNTNQNKGFTNDQAMESIDALIVPELKLRCTQFPTWTAAQVKKCMAFAEDGIEYDPSIFDSDDDEKIINAYSSQAKVLSIDSLFGDSLHEPKGIWSFKGRIRLMKYANPICEILDLVTDFIYLWCRLNVVGDGNLGFAVSVKRDQETRQTLWVASQTHAESTYPKI
jgi:hypothetical protein